MRQGLDLLEMVLDSENRIELNQSKIKHDLHQYFECHKSIKKYMTTFNNSGGHKSLGL